jgi:hypothetical protein
MYTFYFFFSAYRSVKDHCCLQEVRSPSLSLSLSLSLSVVSQVKSYIMIYYFKVASYYIDLPGSWSS